MNKDLQKMFIEDSPQDVNNLVGVENLSDLVVELQKLEDEVKDDEERLKLKTITNDMQQYNFKEKIIVEAEIFCGRRLVGQVEL